MANFDQNVTINLDVDAQGLQSELGAAAAQIETIEESLDGLDGDLDSAANSLEGFADSASNMDAEMEKAAEFAENLKTVAELKDKVSDSNKRLQNEADDSSDAIDVETRSFEQMIEGASTLEEAKHAVSNANERVQNESGKSRDEIIEEKVAMGDLSDEALRLRDTQDGLSDRTQSVTRSIRRMRDATQDSSNAMRAAAEVGDLFDDGLGSLSVNLGAFTVALRNFLTQVPLLLTGLGALGAAATASAASVATLGGALAGLVGVGALTYAQEIKQEFSEINTLGEAMEVVMRNLFDTFLAAIEPLTELNNITSFFTDTVDGLATGVNMLSVAIADLTQGSEKITEAVSDMEGGFYSVQDAFDSIDGSTFQEILNSLMFSWVVLGEEVMWALSTIGSAIADAIVFSTRLLNRVDDLSGAMGNFSDTLAELAELGFKIGGGLLPVFNSFSDIVGTVAKSLNDLDGQMAQNTIAFIALFAASSRVASTLSSIITIVPSVVTGFGQVAAQAKSANSAFGALGASISATGNKLGSFLTSIGALGGFGELAASIFGVDKSFREIAFSSDAATAKFQYLALNSEITAEELQKLAVQGRLTETQMNALAEETDDLDEGLRDTQLQAMLTKEQLDELDDVDIDTDTTTAIQPQNFAPDAIAGGIGGGLFSGMTDSAEEAKDDVKSIFGSGAVAIPGIQGFQAKSSSAFKAFENDAAALQVVKNKFSDMRSSATSTLPTIDGIKSSFGDMKRNAKQAGKSIVGSVVGGLKYLAGSLVTAITKTYAFITASSAERAVMLKNAKAKIAGAASNYALAAAEYVAASGALSLAASLAVATGGITILITAIGALAVGIIANFKEIKSAAAGTFGFLKQIMEVVVDVLITYFIAAWNVLANAFQAVIAGISPLTDMLTDVASSIGLLGGKSEEGAGFMEKLGAAGEFMKDAINAGKNVLIGLVDALGGVLFIISTLVRIGLTPLIAGFKLLVKGVRLYIQILDQLIGKLFQGKGGFEGLRDVMMSLFQGFMEMVNKVPKAVEQMINRVVRLVNKFAGMTDLVSEMDEVDITGSVGTDREDLGSGADNIEDTLFSGGDKTINMKEDNSTNVDQTVNADPEEKSQISRVVKDAMEEADSFSRRKNGFTGN